MRSTYFALIVLATALSAPMPGHASPSPAVVKLFQSGEFLAAAAEGERSATADDLALSSRAVMAEIVTGDGDVDALIARVERLASRALAADPDNVEARLQLALALGLRGRRASIGESVRAGYASRSRKLIEEAQQLNPREPWAHAMLGSWNIEILRRGGAAGAAFYGARLQRGLSAFETARRLAPRDPVIAYNYAVTLLNYDGDQYRDRIDALLRAAENGSAEDAFQRKVQDMARRLRVELKTRGVKDALRTATQRIEASLH